MRFTFTHKNTAKQLTRLGLSALILGMTATSVQAATAFQASDFLSFKELVDQTGSVPSTFSFNGSSSGFTFTSFDAFWTQAKKQTVTELTGNLNFQGRFVHFDASKTSIKVTSADIPALNNLVFNDDPVKGKALKQLQDYVNAHKADVIAQSNSGGLGNQAGNPASHVSQMSYYDSVLDTNGVAAGNVTTNRGRGAGDVGTPNKSRFNSSFRFANYKLGVTSAQLYTLSLGYNWELGNGWGVLFNMPLTYVETGVGNNTNTSYRVSLGTGLRIPLSNYLNLGALKWDLIPLFRVGGVGLGTHLYDNTSIAYSAGVQSNIGAALGYGFSAVMQNQYTYNTDSSLANQKVSTINVPDINVHVYRNSIQLIKDFDAQLFGKTVSTSVSFADVRFDNSKTSKGVDNQQEFGFNVGLKGDGVAANVVRLNVTYTTAPGYNDTFAVNIGGSF